MNSPLLDKFVPAGTRFRPSTISELFALRLAQRLSEPLAARHFANLTDSHTVTQLLCAYRRAIRNGYVDLGRGFHKELGTLP